MKIAASFLSIKEDLNEKIIRLDNTAIDYFHIDVMDGKFVPDDTLGTDAIINALINTTKPKDVHLMVAMNNLREYIDTYMALDPIFITIHAEAAADLDLIIEYIKSKNIKVGLSIKPNTELNTLNKYLDKIDLVLIMSVEPGLGGQTFIENSNDKIDELVRLRDENGYNYLIEVDGGITADNIKSCDVDIAVVGSYITKENDYQKQVNNLK